ncbi:MAG: hypothetical protein ACLQQ4_17385 [Bacteroidia bacterium]
MGQIGEKNNSALKFIYILLFTGVGAILLYATKDIGGIMTAANFLQIDIRTHFIILVYVY